MTHSELATRTHTHNNNYTHTQLHTHTHTHTHTQPQKRKGRKTRKWNIMERMISPPLGSPVLEPCLHLRICHLQGFREGRPEFYLKENVNKISRIKLCLDILTVEKLKSVWRPCCMRTSPRRRGTSDGGSASRARWSAGARRTFAAFCASEECGSGTDVRSVAQLYRYKKSKAVKQLACFCHQKQWHFFFQWILFRLVVHNECKN